MSDDKSGEKPAEGEQIDYKAEIEKLKADNEALKKSSEDLKLEFMTDEYLDFLNNKSGAKSEPAKKEEKALPSDDEFKNLTPRQIYEKAIKDAEEKTNSKLNDFQATLKRESEEKTKSDVKKFAASHDDFDTYRPIMYGLSLDPKNADLNLQELYEKSKAHVKSLAGASDEEKVKSRKSSGEKPGHSSSSFQKGGKKLSADEAGEEAWEEVVGKSGLPPSV